MTSRSGRDVTRTRKSVGSCVMSSVNSFHKILREDVSMEELSSKASNTVRISPTNEIHSMGSRIRPFHWALTSVLSTSCSSAYRGSSDLHRETQHGMQQHNTFFLAHITSPQCMRLLYKGLSNACFGRLATTGS